MCWYQKKWELQLTGNSEAAAYLQLLTYRLCRFCFGELNKLPTFLPRRDGAYCVLL